MSNNTIERKAIVGMNAYSCPSCKKMNYALKRRGKRRQYFGTAFIPLTHLQAATLRAYGSTTRRSVVGKGQGCGHVIDVLVSA